MSDLFRNHIVGFPTRRLKCYSFDPRSRITRSNSVSEVDNDAYYVCTHNFSLCTHKKFRPVRTMYTVKISSTQTVFGFMRTQTKIPLKLTQCDTFSTSFVWLLCQQSKSSYIINAGILHQFLVIVFNLKLDVFHHV